MFAERELEFPERASVEARQREAPGFERAAPQRACRGLVRTTKDDDHRAEVRPDVEVDDVPIRCGAEDARRRGVVEGDRGDATVGRDDHGPRAADRELEGIGPGRHLADDPKCSGTSAVQHHKSAHPRRDVEVPLVQGQGRRERARCGRVPHVHDA
jgi:hypothetical protein